MILFWKLDTTGKEAVVTYLKYVLSTSLPLSCWQSKALLAFFFSSLVHFSVASSTRFSVMVAVATATSTSYSLWGSRVLPPNRRAFSGYLLLHTLQDVVSNKSAWCLPAHIPEAKRVNFNWSWNTLNFTVPWLHQGLRRLQSNVWRIISICSWDAVSSNDSSSNWLRFRQVTSVSAWILLGTVTALKAKRLRFLSHSAMIYYYCRYCTKNVDFIPPQHIKRRRKKIAVQKTECCGYHIHCSAYIEYYELAQDLAERRNTTDVIRTGNNAYDSLPSTRNSTTRLA